MKKVLGLGLAVALFASCSDDDKGGSSVDMDNLVGKWYYVSATANGETEMYDDHETCGKDYLELTSDNMVKFGDVYGCDGTTPQLEEATIGAYTVSGKKVMFVSAEGNQTLTVKKLTSSELKVSYTDDWDGDGDEETITETYSSTQN